MNAHGGHRPRGQPGSTDGLTAVLAAAIAAAGQPEHRRIDLGKVLAGLIRQGGKMLPLKGDRGTFGIVLIVGSCLPRRLDDPGELALEPVQPPDRICPVFFKQCRYGLGRRRV